MISGSGWRTCLMRAFLPLVALYRAIRLRFGYRFESCDANGPRNVKNINLGKQRSVFSFFSSPSLRDAPDTFNFLRHVMRAIWSVRPKCSHRCVPLKETPSKPVQILKHTTFYSAEQTAMRTKWFKHIAI